MHFLPALQNLKYASAVEVCSSSSQPALHSFNCLIRFVVVTSEVIFQGSKQVVVRGDQIQTVGWMGEQFSAVLLNCVWGQTCNVRSDIVMLKDNSFLLQIFFMKRMTKSAEHLRVASCIDCFPFFQKIDHYASLTIPTDSSYNFSGQGFCFWLLSGQCGVMPFHALLYGLWIEVVKPTIIVHHNLERKVLCFCL